MPRFSPPTAIGFPRKRTSAACSTEAKKASASKWTMERMIKSEIRNSKSEGNPNSE
jgi:hypothetical protein